MRRWTDGKTWSPGRVNGRFLTYREMKKESHQTNRSQDEDHTSRFKVNGLIKQSFSITATIGQRLHLISYHSQNLTDGLPIPISDPALQGICPRKCFFPRSLVNDLQNFSVFAREQAKSTESKSHSEPCVRHSPTPFSNSLLRSIDSTPARRARSTRSAPLSPQPINGTSCSHDRFHPPDTPQRNLPDLPSPEDRIIDLCRQWPAQDSTTFSAVPLAQRMTMPRSSSSMSVSKLSQQETPATHTKALLLSHILS